MSYGGISVKFSQMSNVLIVRSSLEMPDAGQRAITAILKKKKQKHFYKSSFGTLLLVSQKLIYDTKAEKNLLFHGHCH
jgi:hypothetical protein